MRASIRKSLVCSCYNRYCYFPKICEFKELELCRLRDMFWCSLVSKQEASVCFFSRWKSSCGLAGDSIMERGCWSCSRVTASSPAPCLSMPSPLGVSHLLSCWCMCPRTHWNIKGSYSESRAKFLIAWWLDLWTRWQKVSIICWFHPINIYFPWLQSLGAKLWGKYMNRCESKLKWVFCV